MFQMLFVDNMGGNDHFPVLTFIHERNKNILVWRPTWACNKHFFICFESLNYRKLLSFLFDLQHSIEASIAYDIDRIYPYRVKQVLALFVLNKEMRKTSQDACITFAIPTEENLMLSEDTTHTIHRYVAVLEDMKIIVPKFIFDEKSHARMHRSQEPTGVANGVNG